MRKPYREFKPAELIEKAKKLKAHMGLEGIDFFSFNFNMYSDFYKLLWELSSIFSRVSLKSQRFDMLAAEPEMVEYQSAAGKTIYSCGLEGISARLRRFLNKNLDVRTLNQSIELMMKAQARELKIFLLSCGMEEDGDFEEFSIFTEQVMQAKRRFNSRARVIFSVTPLVKFPWTPLEFDDAYPAEKHEAVISAMKKIAEANKCEFRQAMDVGEYLISQILVRSTPQIQNALLKTLEDTGFVYYRGITQKFISALIANLKREGISPDELLKGFSLKESEEKPW
ncbi:MAG: radical SAM protein, partial [bacterium]|nr:radical SAM protein [bacterium]